MKPRKVKSMSNKKLQLSRRQLLVWTTPALTSVALPAHAQTTVCPAPPIVNVLAAPKCSGNPPVGTAVFEIVAIDGTPVTLKNIEFTTTDPKSDLSSLPATPVDITDTASETFTWIGPASDALSCLPLAQITMTISYCCEGGDILTETYNITELLIDFGVQSFSNESVSEPEPQESEPQKYEKARIKFLYLVCRAIR